MSCRVCQPRCRLITLLATGMIYLLVAAAATPSLAWRDMACCPVSHCHPSPPKPSPSRQQQRESQTPASQPTTPQPAAVGDLSSLTASPVQLASHRTHRPIAAGQTLSLCNPRCSTHRFWLHWGWALRPVVRVCVSEIRLGTFAAWRNQQLCLYTN